MLFWSRVTLIFHATVDRQICPLSKFWLHSCKALRFSQRICGTRRSPDFVDFRQREKCYKYSRCLHARGLNQRARESLRHYVADLMLRSLFSLIDQPVFFQHHHEWPAPLSYTTTNANVSLAKAQITKKSEGTDSLKAQTCGVDHPNPDYTVYIFHVYYWKVLFTDPRTKACVC